MYSLKASPAGINSDSFNFYNSEVKGINQSFTKEIFHTPLKINMEPEKYRPWKRKII